MATFLSDFVEQLDIKWGEVDLLLSEAEQHQESNPELLNAICRSITVLIVAHLEGFSKDLIKAVIRDANQHCSFRDLPDAVQRTYCKLYLGDGDSKAYQQKFLKLKNKFSDLESKISHEPFYWAADNNPKPDTLKTVFNNFGFNNVFLNLNESNLDNVFSETHNEINEHIESTKEILKEEIDNFPYRCTLNRLSLEPTTRPSSSRRTLWEEFLDQTNSKRHAIAHGAGFDNIESVSNLKTTKGKIVYLQLALIGLLASSLNSNENAT